MIWTIWFIVVASVFGFLVGLMLRAAILRASCALAEVKEPSFPLALCLAFALALVHSGVFWILNSWLARFEADPDNVFGAWHVFSALLALVIALVAAALLYRLILASSVLKSFAVAGIEFLVGSLAGALLLMALLAALSVWQLLGYRSASSDAPSRSAAPAVAVALLDPS